MNVLTIAVDPGTHKFGVAAFYNEHVIQTTLISSNNFGKTFNAGCSRRFFLINELENFCSKLLQEVAPGCQIHFVYESTWVTGNWRPDFNRSVYLLYVLGALDFWAKKMASVYRWRVYNHPTNEIKSFIGGRIATTKKDVQAAMMELHNVNDSLSNDEYDAISIGHYHLAKLKRELPGEFTVGVCHSII